MANRMETIFQHYVNAAAPLIKALSDAIADGDLCKARESAVGLSKMKAKLDIRMASTMPEQISINVVVQRLGLERATIRLHVTTNWTFRHLQLLVEQNHGIPSQMQKWIVRRQFPRDDATLTSFGVKTGSVLGLYVMSARFARIKELPPEVVTPETHKPQVQSFRPVINPSLKAPPNFVDPYWSGRNNVVGFPKSAPVKWCCTNCTYMNEATRPSCEMCLTDRPQNFVVPPDCQPSKVERDRLEGEAKMTTLFQQTQEMELAPRQYYIVENGRRIALGDEAHFVPNRPQFVRPGARDHRHTAPHNFVDTYWRGMNNIFAVAKPAPVKWFCTNCTYMNEATRPSCEMCATDRPQNFVVPPDYQPSKVERDRMENEARMTRLFQQNQMKEAVEKQHYIAENLTQIAVGDEAHFIPNDEEFECPVCFTEVAPREGVVLRNCVHEFCIPCLEETIKHSEGADVKCPFANQEYQCDAPLQDREIAGIVKQADFDSYLTRSLRTAEGREKNSFHCLTPNCIGWCIDEEKANFFQCPVCNARNCLRCKLIHGNLSCQQYHAKLERDRLAKLENERQANLNRELQATQAGLQDMLRTGDAKNCPSCGVIVQKNGGCDHMQCTRCNTHFSWGTGLRR